MCGKWCDTASGDSVAEEVDGRGSKHTLLYIVDKPVLLKSKKHLLEMDGTLLATSKSS